MFGNIIKSISQLQSPCKERQSFGKQTSIEVQNEMKTSSKTYTDHSQGNENKLN